MYVICGHQEMKLHCQTVQQRKARYYNDCFPIGLLCQSGHLFVSVATCFDGRRPVRNKQVQGIQRTLRGYNRVRLLQTYSGASHSPSSTKNSSWTLGRSNPRQACKGYAKVAERRFSTNLPVFPEPPRMKQVSSLPHWWWLLRGTRPLIMYHIYFESVGTTFEDNVESSMIRSWLGVFSLVCHYNS